MILSIQRFLKKNAREGVGFIMLAALILGVVSVPVAFRKTESDMWALRVNGQPVGYMRFMREVFQYKEFIASLKSTYGQFADYILSSMGMSTQPEQIAIDKLIRQEILDQLGATIGLRSHPDYISSKVKDPKFMRNFVSEVSLKSDGTFDMDILRKELSHYGLSVSEFEHTLSQGIMRDFLINLFDVSFYAPQFDVRYIRSMRHAARDLVIMEFPYEHVLQRVKQEPISDGDAQNYFLIRNRSSKQYWSNEYRDGVVFKIARSSYKTAVSESDIVNYYEQNKLKKYVKNPAKVVVQKITNTDFEKLSPGIDLSVVSAHGSGEQYDSLWQDVDAFSRGTHEEAFERAAFGLKHPGDVSSVAALNNGTSVVLRLVRMIPREYTPIELVRDSILKTLQTSEFKKQFTAEANDLIRQGEVDEFAQRSGVIKSTLSRITSDGGDSVSSRLFEIKNTGDFTTYVDNDYGYIMQLSHIDPSVEQEFSQVKELVFDDMYAEKAHLEMNVLLESAQERIVESGIQYVVSEYGASILFDGLMIPSDENEMKKIEKYGIYSELLTFLDKKGMAHVLKTEPAGMLLYIKDIVAPEQVQEDPQELIEISKEKMSLATSALVASFYRNAKIEINELIRGNRSEE